MRAIKLLLVGPVIAIFILLGGLIGVGMAEASQYSFIANDIAQHTSFLASNVEWHTAAIAAIANIKYLNTKDVAARYRIDPRSVQRRVKEGLLPPPYYFGTRFPRWEITELDTHDRRMAMARVPNRGALAAAKAKAAAAKPAEDKINTEIESARRRGRRRPLEEPLDDDI